MNKILETERLILREMSMDDLEALYKVLGDPDIMQHYPYSFDKARVVEWIERNMNRYRNDGFGLWAVCLKETGEMIGDCGLTLQNIEGEMLPEIGYHIRKDQQHNGYAKEAAAAVRDWAFQNTGYPALYSYCKYTNEGSIKTAESIGMYFEKEYPDDSNKITHVSVLHRDDPYGILCSVPDSIRKHISGKRYSTDDIGKSGSSIFIFDNMVLKIVDSRKYDEESSVQVMRWLEGKLPAPQVIVFEKDTDHQYLLMSRIRGMMTCDDYYMEHPDELFEILSEALKMLWNVDISDCPKTRDIDARLKEARYRVEHDMVDVDDSEPTTYGEGGFKDPEELLKWLEDNKPDYEPVLSHGDLCLPNILVEDGRISGFIDLDGTAVGDKWQDIALCYRSLKHNADGTFGGKIYPDFDPAKFFDVLGIKPDWDKINYFILLDELF